MRNELIALVLIGSSTIVRADILGDVVKTTVKIGETARQAVDEATKPFLGETRTTQKFPARDCRPTGESTQLIGPEVFNKYLVSPEKNDYRVVTSEVFPNPGNIRGKKPIISVALGPDHQYTYRLQLCGTDGCHTRVGSGDYTLENDKVILNGLGEASVFTRAITCTNDMVKGERLPNGEKQESMRVKLDLPGLQGNTLETGVIVTDGPAHWTEDFAKLKGEYQTARQKKLAGQYYEQMKESGTAQLGQFTHAMAKEDLGLRASYGNSLAYNAMRTQKEREVAIRVDPSSATYPELVQPADDGPSFFVPPRSQW